MKKKGDTVATSSASQSQGRRKQVAKSATQAVEDFQSQTIFSHTEMEAEFAGSLIKEEDERAELGSQMEHRAPQERTFVKPPTNETTEHGLSIGTLLQTQMPSQARLGQDGVVSVEAAEQRGTIVEENEESKQLEKKITERTSKAHSPAAPQEEASPRVVIPNENDSKHAKEILRREEELLSPDNVAEEDLTSPGVRGTEVHSLNSSNIKKQLHRQFAASGRLGETQNLKYPKNQKILVKENSVLNPNSTAGASKFQQFSLLSSRSEGDDQEKPEGHEQQVIKIPGADVGNGSFDHDIKPKYAHKQLIVANISYKGSQKGKGNRSAEHSHEPSMPDSRTQVDGLGSQTSMFGTIAEQMQREKDAKILKQREIEGILEALRPRHQVLSNTEKQSRLRAVPVVEKVIPLALNQGHHYLDQFALKQLAESKESLEFIDPQMQSQIVFQHHGSLRDAHLPASVSLSPLPPAMRGHGASLTQTGNHTSVISRGGSESPTRPQRSASGESATRPHKNSFLQSKVKVNSDLRSVMVRDTLSKSQTKSPHQTQQSSPNQRKKSVGNAFAAGKTIKSKPSPRQSKRLSPQEKSLAGDGSDRQVSGKREESINNDRTRLLQHFVSKFNTYGLLQGKDKNPSPDRLVGIKKAGSDTNTGASSPKRVTVHKQLGIVGKATPLRDALGNESPVGRRSPRGNIKSPRLPTMSPYYPSSNDGAAYFSNNASVLGQQSPMMTALSGGLSPVQEEHGQPVRMHGAHYSSMLQSGSHTIGHHHELDYNIKYYRVMDAAQMTTHNADMKMMSGAGVAARTARGPPGKPRPAELSKISSTHGKTKDAAVDVQNSTVKSNQGESSPGSPLKVKIHMKRTGADDQEAGANLAEGQSTLTSDALAQRLGSLLNADFDQQILSQMAAKNITSVNQMTQFYQQRLLVPQPQARVSPKIKSGIGIYGSQRNWSLIDEEDSLAALSGRPDIEDDYEEGIQNPFRLHRRDRATLDNEADAIAASTSYQALENDIASSFIGRESVVQRQKFAPGISQGGPFFISALGQTDELRNFAGKRMLSQMPAGSQLASDNYLDPYKLSDEQKKRFQQNFVLKIDPVKQVGPNGSPMNSQMSNYGQAPNATNRDSMQVVRGAAINLGWVIDGDEVDNDHLHVQFGQVSALRQHADQREVRHLKQEHRALIDVFWFQSVDAGERSFANQSQLEQKTYYQSQYADYHRINQFPGIDQLLRCDFLLPQIQKMQELFPIDFKICPRTYLFPPTAQTLEQLTQSQTDLNQLEVDSNSDAMPGMTADAHKVDFLIVKPVQKSFLSMSTEPVKQNIVLRQSIADVMNILHASRQSGLERYYEAQKATEGQLAAELDSKAAALLSAEPMYLIQKLLTSPFLIDNRSFETRCYVLLLSCKPLTVYVYNEGIAIISSKDYSLQDLIEGDADQVQPSSSAVSPNKDQIMYLSEVLGKMKRKSGVTVEELRFRMNDVVIKSLMSLQAELIYRYKLARPNDSNFLSCFQLMSFDMIFDADCRPMVLDAKVINQPDSSSISEERSLLKRVVQDTFRVLMGKNWMKRKQQHFCREKHTGSMPSSPAWNRASAAKVSGRSSSLAHSHEQSTFDLRWPGQDAWTLQDLEPLLQRDTGNFKLAFPIVAKTKIDAAYEKFRAFTKEAHVLEAQWRETQEKKKNAKSSLLASSPQIDAYHSARQSSHVLRNEAIEQNKIREMSPTLSKNPSHIQRGPSPLFDRQDEDNESRSFSQDRSGNSKLAFLKDSQGGGDIEGRQLVMQLQLQGEPSSLCKPNILRQVGSGAQLIEATFDSPEKSARIPGAEIEESAQSKKEIELQNIKVSATEIRALDAQLKTPSDSKPTPSGIQTINVVLSQSRENNKVAIHVDQPSHRLFKSSYDAKNYYRRFQKVVDNMAKMRGSLLPSPAQKTARGQRLQVGVSGLNHRTSESPSPLIAPMKPSLQTLTTRNVTRNQNLSGGQSFASRSPPILDFSGVMAGDKTAEGADDARAVARGASELNTIIKQREELLETATSLMKKYLQPKQRFQALRQVQVGMPADARESQKFTEAFKVMHNQSEGFPQRKRASMHVQLDKVKIGDLAAQHRKRGDGDLPGYHQRKKHSIAHLPRSSAKEALQLKPVGPIKPPIDLSVVQHDMINSGGGDSEELRSLEKVGSIEQRQLNTFTHELLNANSGILSQERAHQHGSQPSFGHSASEVTALNTAGVSDGTRNIMGQGLNTRPHLHDSALQLISTVDEGYSPLPFARDGSNVRVQLQLGGNKAQSGTDLNTSGPSADALTMGLTNRLTRNPSIFSPRNLALGSMASHYAVHSVTRANGYLKKEAILKQQQQENLRMTMEKTFIMPAESRVHSQMSNLGLRSNIEPNQVIEESAEAMRSSERGTERAMHLLQLTSKQQTHNFSFNQAAAFVEQPHLPIHTKQVALNNQQVRETDPSQRSHGLGGFDHPSNSGGSSPSYPRVAMLDPQTASREDTTTPEALTVALKQKIAMPVSRPALMRNTIKFQSKLPSLKTEVPAFMTKRINVPNTTKNDNTKGPTQFKTLEQNNSGKEVVVLPQPKPSASQRVTENVSPIEVTEEPSRVVISAVASPSKEPVCSTDAAVNTAETSVVGAPFTLDAQTQRNSEHDRKASKDARFEHKYGYAKDANVLDVRDIRRLQAERAVDDYLRKTNLLEAQLNVVMAARDCRGRNYSTFRFGDPPSTNLYERSGACGALLTTDPSVVKLKAEARSKSTFAPSVKQLRLPSIVGQGQYIPSSITDHYENSKLPSHQDLRHLNQIMEGRIMPSQASAHVRRLVGVEKERSPMARAAELAMVRVSKLEELTAHLEQASIAQLQGLYHHAFGTSTQNTPNGVGALTEELARVASASADR